MIEKEKSERQEGKELPSNRGKAVKREGAHSGLEQPQNRDINTGPLTRPLAHSLASLTRSLALHCFLCTAFFALLALHRLLRLRAPLRSLVRSLAHSLPHKLVEKCDFCIFQNQVVLNHS